MKSDAIDKYKLAEKLGEGSFGEVWLGRDLKRDEKVAIKFLKLGRITQDYLEKFKHEFEILSKIRHKNLAIVFDFGYSPKKEQYFFTSEFCSGIDFMRAAAGKPVSYIEEMLVQVLSALDYIHSQGIAHFDIKSENILVSEKEGHPHVKILDFGLAARLKELPEGFVGTPAYMAPEIILKGSRIDHRADLYSLGILLLRTLTRRSPFNAENIEEVLRWHLKGEIPEALWRGFQIPRYMKELVEKLLKKRPEERFSNARIAMHFLNLSTAKKYIKAEQDLVGILPRIGPLVERGLIVEELRTSLELSITQEKTRDVSQVRAISGVQGIGKSRMIDEIRHVLQLKEIPFLELVCNWEVPSWPKIEKWLDLSLGSLKGESEEWQTRRRVDAIIEAGKKRPFCFLFDDFHKADLILKAVIPALYDKLNFYRSEGQKIPIFVLIATEGAMKNAIPLERLSQTGIEQFINIVFGEAERGGEIARLLYRYSGGLPLLVVEGMRFLAPHLYRHESLENLLPPPHIGLLYKEKIKALKNEEFEFLALLALLFRPVTEDELSIITGHSPAIVGALADVCIKNDLLIRSVLPEDEKTVLQISSQALSLDIIRSMKPKKIKEMSRWIAEGLAKTGIASLNELAYFTAKSGEVEKAIEYYRSASSDFKKKQQISQAADCLVKAVTISPPKGSIYTRLLQEASELLISAGSYREADIYLKKLDSKNSYEIEELKGTLELQQRHLKEAEEHYQKALELLTQDNKIVKIAIENALGNIALQKGEYQKAVEIFRDSLNEEMALPLEERRKIFNNSLGIALVMLGRTDEATQFYKEQLGKLTPDMTLEEISVAHCLGFVLMQASQYDEAIPYLMRAVELSEKTGAMNNLFATIGNLINALVKEARYSESLPFLKKMTDYQERLGTTKDIGYNLLREGSIYLLVGMEESADECFKKGYKLSKEMNNPTLATWFLLMEGYRQRNYYDTAKAKELFNIVITEATEQKDKSLLDWAHYALADLAYELEECDECEKQLGMIMQVEDDEFKARIDILKAKIEAHKFEGDLNALFIPIETFCHRKKFPEILWEVYHAWGRAIRGRGYNDEAGHLFCKGIAIIEKIASSLPEEYRDRYLSQHTRKKLFQDLKEIMDETKLETCE